MTDSTTDQPWTKWEPTRWDKVALMSKDTRDVIRGGIFAEGVRRSQPPKRPLRELVIPPRPTRPLPASPQEQPPAEPKRLIRSVEKPDGTIVVYVRPARRGEEVPVVDLSVVGGTDAPPPPAEGTA